MRFSFGLAVESRTIDLWAVENGWKLFPWGYLLGHVKLLQPDYNLIGDWAFSWASSFWVDGVFLVLDDIGLEDVTGLAIILDDVADVAKWSDLFDDHFRLDWGEKIENFLV